ncbi:hypothetical protein IOK49_05015 [Fervidicoccus fontis]|uniref:Uncharacterized protein n=2 Tax=Fervidicoccus fontis TaxID=683846 RepID=I0A207_FERFK|nr:hypothetical protein [Fervidicoccus fontis]AFH43014.1 hypothetical protein FFONT_1026 [Fervidicoccus fontis Kam940]MBE9391432.1 hypothetical protein [Fervidicoccus fontis]PMB75654.1 MAG: hypothetical protein C0188_02350 [Fervidicoccus fontis]PMB76574.1 MAG: hypothetical protein C0177_05725 [Fervidicoccus fontis]HEW63989.1 hypothetical protein [Fervidicoccus fontis]
MSDEEKIKLKEIFPCEVGKKKVDVFLKKVFGYGVDKILNDCFIFYCNERKKRKDIFCMSKELENLYARLKENGILPYSIGLFLGSIMNNRYKPSLQLGSEISLKAKKLEKGIIYVKNAKISFGKTISLNEIALIKRNESGIYLVLLQDETFLGWGILKRKILVPLADIGLYLRGFEFS